MALSDDVASPADGLLVSEPEFAHADTPRILILEPFVVHVAIQSAPLDDIMFPLQVVALGDRLTDTFYYGMCVQQKWG